MKFTLPVLGKNYDFEFVNEKQMNKVKDLYKEDGCCDHGTYFGISYPVIQEAYVSTILIEHALRNEKILSAKRFDKTMNTAIHKLYRTIIHEWAHFVEDELRGLNVDPLEVTARVSELTYELTLTHMKYIDKQVEALIKSLIKKENIRRSKERNKKGGKHA